MTEERDDVILLIDEEGQEVEFEMMDSIEMNGNEYVVLIPLEADEDVEETDVDEVVILKVEHTGEDEDTFVSVDDEKELEAVFEEFKRRVEEEYDVEE